MLTRITSVLFAVVIPLATSVAAAGCDAAAVLRSVRSLRISARPAAGASIEIDTGDRTNRLKARLKYVLDGMGVDKFMAAVEERLGRPLTRVPPAWHRACGRCSCMWLPTSTTRPERR